MYTRNGYQEKVRAELKRHKMSAEPFHPVISARDKAAHGYMFSRKVRVETSVRTRVRKYKILQ
jgi:hypothetical protein